MKVEGVALGLATALALGPIVSADNQWGKYHWARTSNPFTLTLGDNLNTAAWRTVLSEASGDWSASAVLDTTVVAGRASSDCQPATGKVEICNANYGNNNWLGIAQIWITGSHITKGAVKVNDYYFNQAAYNTRDWRDLVMCQEVGHIFGLDHQDENFSNGNLGTCMDYTSDPDGPPPNLQPNPHDYYMLDAVIYDHLDGNCKGPAWKCSGAQQPPAPAFEMSLPDAAQWGRLMATSRDGGQSIFMQDFGGGHRVYTFTTWTLDAAAQLAQP